MDLRRRELERKASMGDLGAEVRLLVQRIREGTLEEKRIEQAAYIGNASSRMVFNEDERQFVDAAFDVFIKGLACAGVQSETVECGQFGNYGHRGSVCGCTNGKITRLVPDREFLLRCAVAAARCANCVMYSCRCFPLIVIWGHREHAEGCSIDAALTAAEAWLDCPCSKHEDAWHIACSGDQPEWVPDPLWVASDLRDCIQSAAQVAKSDAVRAAIKDVVVPWLLR